MTQNALIPITPNTLAKSEDVMGNFEYLEELIQTYVAEIEDKADADTVSSQITTLSNSLTTTNTNVSNLSNFTNPTINTLATSGTIALSDNSINVVTPAGAITFTLPSVTDNTKFHQILVQVKMSTLYSINVGTTYYFNKKAPNMSATGTYNIIFEYDKQNSVWVCGAIKKGTV